MKSNSKNIALRRKLILSIFSRLYHLLCSIEISGIENIPTSGPYIVVFNHVSIYDPPAVLSLLPIQPEVFAASYLFKKPGLSTLLRLYGAVAIQRKAFSRKALIWAKQVIADNGTLLMSPEGTRSGEPGMNKAKAGIAYIAGNSDCQVIPVGIEGTTRNMFGQALRFSKPEVKIKVGKPLSIHLDNDKGRKSQAELREKTDQIMVKIAELLPESYWGYYAKFM